MINELSLHQQCPCCESVRLKNKYVVQGYTITVCTDCSVLFVRNVLTVGVLQEYYRDLEANLVYEEENKNFLDRYYRRVINEVDIIRNDNQKGAILDVGCSAGYFLQQMVGWERYGVEISRKYADKAKAKFGDSIVWGSFEDYPTRKAYFDVITLQDSFDHMVDPYSVLVKCRENLKKGGLIVIKVHNISCLWAKLTGRNFYAILPPMHLFYFSEKPLKELLKRTGYRYLKKRFFGQVLALESVFFRLSLSGQKKHYYLLYKLIKGTTLGRIPIYKQLNDIITVFAVRE